MVSTNKPRHFATVCSCISKCRRLPLGPFLTRDLSLTRTSEMRVTLSLPLSGLGDLEYPYLFPSPPTPSSPVQLPTDVVHAPTPLSNASQGSSASPTILLTSPKAEEISWFYYLGEIAIRRIENRIINAFYQEDSSSWSHMNVDDMAAAAADFERQLQNWYVTSLSSIQVFAAASTKAGYCTYSDMSSLLTGRMTDFTKLNRHCTFIQPFSTAIEHKLVFLFTC